MGPRNLYWAIQAVSQNHTLEILQLPHIGHVISIVQIGKLRPKEVKGMVQGHPASVGKATMHTLLALLAHL